MLDAFELLLVWNAFPSMSHDVGPLSMGQHR